VRPDGASSGEGQAGAGGSAATVAFPAGQGEKAAAVFSSAGGAVEQRRVNREVVARHGAVARALAQVVWAVPQQVVAR